MPGPGPDEQRTIGLDVDADFSKILEQVANLDDQFSNIEGQVEEISEEGAQALSDRMGEVVNLSSNLSDLTGDINEKFDTSQQEVEAIQSSVEEFSQKMDELSDLQDEWNEAQKEGAGNLDEIQEKIDEKAESLESIHQQTIQNIQEQQDAFREAARGAGLMRGVPEDFGERMGDSVAQEIGNALQNPDLESHMTSLAEPLDDAIQGKLNAAFSQTEAERLADGGEGGRGGILGAATEGAAAVAGGEAAEEGVEATAESAGGLRSILNTLTSTMGKLVGVLGGVAGLVSILFKAGQQAQELNKELFKTTSYAELANSRFINAKKAIYGLRSAVTDMNLNLQLGLDPKEGMQMITTLHEQGVEIDQLARKYGSMEQAATTAIRNIQQASLALAADSKEVSKFITRMSEKQGKPLARTMDQMAGVVEMAEESTVAYNQFFSALMSITDGMSLYNFRLNETTNLLAKMNTLLDAEKAKQFAKAAVQAGKKMSQEEAFKRIALTGGMEEAMNMVRENIQRELENLGNREAVSGAVEQITGGEVTGTKDLMSRLRKVVEQGRMPEFLHQLKRRNVGENARRNIQRLGQRLAQSYGNVLQKNEAFRKRLSASNAISTAMEAMEQMAREEGTTFQEISNKMASKITDMKEANIEALKTLRAELGINLKQLREETRNWGELNQDERESVRHAVEKLADKKGLNISVDEKGRLINKQTGNIIQDLEDAARALSEKRLKQAGLSEEAREQTQYTQSVKDILSKTITDLLNTIAGGVSSMSRAIIEWWQGGKTIGSVAAEERQKYTDLQGKLAEMKEPDSGVSKTKVESFAKKVQKQKKIVDMLEKGKKIIPEEASDLGAETIQKEVRRYVKGGYEMGFEEFIKKREPIIKERKFLSRHPRVAYDRKVAGTALKKGQIFKRWEFWSKNMQKTLRKRARKRAEEEGIAFGEAFRKETKEIFGKELPKRIKKNIRVAIEEGYEERGRKKIKKALSRKRLMFSEVGPLSETTPGAAARALTSGGAKWKQYKEMVIETPKERRALRNALTAESSWRSAASAFSQQVQKELGSTGPTHLNPKITVKIGDEEITKMINKGLHDNKKNSRGK